MTSNSFEERRLLLEQKLGEPITISGLTGDVRIFQRERGHRHSIDDATTAWYALKRCASATSYLDLGTGIGTVGMIVFYSLPASAQMVCVEAQEISYELLVANLDCNGFSNRVTPIFGDLRNLNLSSKFELITGSPPYFPVGQGTLPKDSQKAHARFELRGHVGDYAKIAKRHLRDSGVFVYCFPFLQKQRSIDLVTAEGFFIERCLDVKPTAQNNPLFSVFVAKLTDCGPMIEEPPLIVQGEDGRYTEAMLQIQATRGFGPQGTNS